MNRILLVIMAVVCGQSNMVNAGSYNIITDVKEVMGYAQTSNYLSDHCLVVFSETTSSVCASKSTGVIKTDKGIGDLLCGIAMTALVSGKKIRVASHDDVCDPLHTARIKGSEYLKYSQGV